MDTSDGVSLALEKMADIAKMFIGVREDTPNDGPLIRLWQEAINGKAERQPYCFDFCHWVAQNVDLEMHDLVNNWQPYTLPKTESVVAALGLIPAQNLKAQPFVGGVAMWRMWSKDSDGLWHPTTLGHCGVVTDILPESLFKTVESNTSDPAGNTMIRDGVGTFAKIRTAVKGVGSFRYAGCVSPWA